MGDSSELYRLDDWSMGYFQVGDAGNLMVRPDQQVDHRIDLFEVVQGLEERGIRTPLTIGFPDPLRRRIEEMVGAFSDAMEHNDYKGSYSGVYPVKVNQQRFLVEQVEAMSAEEAREWCPIVQVGLRAVDLAEVARLDEERVVWAHQISGHGAEADWIDRAVNHLTDEVYVTIDLDGFDPSLVPATGTPEPGGGHDAGHGEEHLASGGQQILVGGCGIDQSSGVEVAIVAVDEISYVHGSHARWWSRLMEASRAIRQFGRRWSCCVWM